MTDSTQHRANNFLRAPRFEGDDEKTRIAQVLNVVLLVLLGATLLGYLAVLVSAALVRIIAITCLVLIELISYLLLQRGYVRQAALFLCLSGWIVLVAALTLTGGVDGSSNPVQTVVIISAGLLLGGSAGLIFAALGSLAGLVMLIAEINGFLPTSLIEPNPTSYWIFTSLTFFSSAGLVYITVQSLREAVQRAQSNEKAQIEANQQLEAARMTLEAQVAERTQALEQRSRYLQASIEVSRAAASILEPDQLIEQTVELIQEQFNLYYVGLFLVDAEGEWAVLKAGTGQAGRSMVNRGHRIRLGTGMIGWSITNSAPRVAQAATEDSQRLATPELPETRSEAAIPLRSRGKTLGAITVQSSQPNAFGDVEVVSFQSMADQVALAIDNAQLLEESQQAIQEVQRAYGISSRLAWQEMLQTGQRMAYRYQGGRVMAVKSQPDAEAAGSSEESTQPAQLASKAMLRVPIKVREQIIGVVRIQPASEVTWSEDELAVLQSLSDQLGVALESARLYQDSQRLALREQITSEVTSRIRETLDLEAVLKTAVQEIQKTMGVPEVVISLGTQANDPSLRSTGDPSLRSTGDPSLRSTGDPSLRSTGTFPPQAGDLTEGESPR
jgi:GAF domain-containing protein